MKMKKILIFVLIQLLILCHSAKAFDFDRYQSTFMLSPEIKMELNVFQILYLKNFQSIFDRATVEEAYSRTFQDHEEILYAFGKSYAKRDFSRPDIYIASSIILDELYKDHNQAKSFIQILDKGQADRKLKILSIALLIELFKSAEFYNTEVLNNIIDKVMKESIIRATKYPMATANFHYYVNTKNKNWFRRLWISIMHELGHNIRFNIIDDKEYRRSKRHIASINEFFADLCPYIVSINNNWQDIVLLLREYSKKKHIQSKKANQGILIDAHLASQAQWYRLLRGVSIYSSKENLPKLVAIFHAALSEKYNNAKRFIEWIYRVNGFGAKLKKLVDKLEESRVSHGVEEILLADFSINSIEVEKVLNTPASIFKSNIIEFKPKIIVHSRPFSVLCNISRIIQKNENIKMHLRILNSRKKSLLKIGIPLGDIRLPERFFINIILPVISRYWVPKEDDPGKFQIKESHFFQIEFISDKGNGIIPSDKIVFILNNFFSNRLKRDDNTNIDVSFYKKNTEKNSSLSEADLEEITRILGYKSSQLTEENSVFIKRSFSHIQNLLIPQAI